MCGVFGFLSTTEVEVPALEGWLRELFLLSESRGKEASGAAVRTRATIEVYKTDEPAHVALQSREYQEFVGRSFGKKRLERVALIGHCRLVTNGSQADDRNNQPVAKDDIVTIHNGIIVNDAELWAHYPDLSPRQSEVDTEVFNSLWRMFIRKGMSPGEAFQKTFQEIRGAATIAGFLADREQLFLGTNNGSLYWAQDPQSQFFVFTSERPILRKFLETSVGLPLREVHIEAAPADTGMIVDLRTLAQQQLNNLSFRHDLLLPEQLPPAVTAPRRICVAQSEDESAQWRRDLRRCRQCLLPETFPLLSFDESGLCGICSNYEKHQVLGAHALEEFVRPHRKPGGGPECIVAISGGRDSCYGLHYVKNVLGLRPIAYTYDWGMVTDLARRNISRMCAELGVEHVLVSADIEQKRRNIRMNVEAWLKRPELGMVPLLMAGDKQYFYHAHELGKEYDLKLVFYFPNHLEKTRFKTGFCGVDESKGLYMNMGLVQKAQLASYYGRQFLLNPRYFNTSLMDSFHAFYSTFFLPHHNLCSLYDYIPWREEEIVSTITQRYGWERAADTTTTWRIGDGTAAFYNLIYLEMAGFTENDTFYSNHVREGLMSREEAWEKAHSDNQIRFEAIDEYARLVGFDARTAIRIVRRAPKLYGPQFSPHPATLSMEPT